MAPSFSGSKKRPLEMVVYDAAANKRARDEEDETSTSTSTSPNAAATALFLLGASAPPPFGDLEPISAVPISAVPPQLPPPHPRTPRPPVAGAREEPPCLRKHFLQALGLRAELPVHFIDAKCLTTTDLDPHQNRLRIPRDGAIYRLRPLLTAAELHDANLLHIPDPAPNPKRRRRSAGKQKQQQPAAEPPQNDDGALLASSSAVAAETTKKIKKPKAKGKMHGGLRVRLVNLDAGAKDLLLSRWNSSRGTIVKGEGYLDFIRQCGFKANDAVEVWAFVQRRFRIFGNDIFGDSLLHVLIVKKDNEQPQRCRYCRHPPASAVNPSVMSS